MPTKEILSALDITMNYNLFQFGDTFWKQVSGAAMGAPPACCIAMLYYIIHELKLLPLFTFKIPFYRRYIDDGFGIWLRM